ncbi:hypothetical protein BX666DRAFT_1115931 [Dichotomocladium elegans]|nr:hypothetical protein BX666DRAFT_1115931 [Dichotomocladium elegans]
MVSMPCLKSIRDMPGVCTVVVSALWGKHTDSLQPWNDQRRLEFYVFCQHLFTYINVSPAVVYTSIRYVKRYLGNAPARESLMLHGAERSIFMAALLLAYKVVEDCGIVDVKYWSQIGTIPVQALNQLELAFLTQINHRLHLDKVEFAHWVNQCNDTFEQLLSCAASAGYCYYYYYYPDTTDVYAATTTKPVSSEYPCYTSSWYCYGRTLADPYCPPQLASCYYSQEQTWSSHQYQLPLAYSMQ